MSLTPTRLLAAVAGLVILLLVLGQFSWQIAILVVLFLALVVPFMAAVMSGDH